MNFKTLVLIGLFANASAHLRADNKVAEEELEGIYVGEQLDLELEIEGGERQLFPLLPGVKCPPGHKCHVRQSAFHSKGSGVPSMMSSLKNNYKTSLSASLDWGEISKTLNKVVVSDDYCTRRNAMQRAAGLAAGLGLAAVSQPAFAAETKEVLMGTDSGGLKFVPEKTSICKGDSVKWINNKGGPHNVVFDEDAIPAGVSQEKISMDDQLGEEGDTFSMSFDVAGTYEYYCEPHRGAGMNAVLVVA